MKPVNRRNISFFQQASRRVLLFLICILINYSVSAQDTPVDSVTSVSAKKTTPRKLFGGEITSIGYGGPVIKFSGFNNQFALMTGGRGACVINNRYTIGGGGYGIANAIRLSGRESDTVSYFKMGYGGLETGFIFYKGNKVNFGGSLLIAAGAAFRQNKRNSDHKKISQDGFKIFPVLEPSLYGELTVSRIMRLQAGISYRYVITDLSYIRTQKINGFSCFVGFLFGK